MLNAIREASRPADLLVVGLLVILVVAVPILNLLVPETSPLHVSTFTVTLLGKYMSFAMLALSVDLIWATAESSLWVTVPSSRSAGTRWGCT